MTMTSLECNDGAPHDWQFAGQGQRRCPHCKCFGFIPKIRVGHAMTSPRAKSRSPQDSQGVAFHLCQRRDCERRAVGKDIITLHNGRKEWRCTDHRGEYT